MKRDSLRYILILRLILQVDRYLDMELLDMETNKYSHLHDWGSSEVGECGRLDADTMILLVDLEILLLDEVAALGALQLGLPGLGGLLQGAVVRRQILHHLHC